jgi:hypothetical protein
MSIKPVEKLAERAEQSSFIPVDHELESIRHIYERLGFLPYSKKELDWVTRLAPEALRVSEVSPSRKTKTPPIRTPGTELARVAINSRKFITGVFINDSTRRVVADPSKKPNQWLHAFEDYAQGASKGHRQLDILAEEIRGVLSDERDGDEKPKSEALLGNELSPLTYDISIDYWRINRDLKAIADNPYERPEPARNPYSSAYEQRLGPKAMSELMYTTTVGEVNDSIGGFIEMLENRHNFWFDCIGQISAIDPTVRTSRFNLQGMAQVAMSAGNWIETNSKF